MIEKRDTDLRAREKCLWRTLSVPVDLSDGSRDALLYGWHLAKRLGLNVEVVYAMDSIFEGYTPSTSGFLSGYRKTMLGELESFIGDALGSIGVVYEPPAQNPGTPGAFEERRQEPRITSKVIYGTPFSALETYSRQADLMVMGATGRSGISKKYFGSVSVEVSKNARCPVLFVPEGSGFQGFGHIVFATDFVLPSKKVNLRQLLNFARVFESQLHFLHVGPGTEKDLDNQLKRLESTYRTLEPDVPFLFSKMVGDNVVEALFEYSLSHPVDVLVLLPHRRSFWENILHKSITAEVLSRRDLPILVLHEED